MPDAGSILVVDVVPSIREMLAGPDKIDEAINTTLNIPNREAFLQMSGEWIANHYGIGR